ncbi:MAG: amidohydrolase family protein [Gemmatimonadota bacterium]
MSMQRGSAPVSPVSGTGLTWARSALLVVAGVIALMGSAVAQRVAIRAGTVVDPAAGRTGGPQVIVVDSGRIVAAGPDVTIPPGATVIDLSDMVVMPGLFDAHTHLTAAYDPAVTKLREYTIAVSTAERALQGVVNGWEMLSTGFTTVRDLGNAGNYADAALATFFGNGDGRRAAIYGSAVLSGLTLYGHRPVGPTIVYAGKIISPFGGQFQLSPEQEDIGRQDYIYADTRDQLREAVRHNIHYGATWIKLTVDDYPYHYSADDIRFVVAEAALAGVRVTTHCVTDAGARAAIEAGVASIEHGYAMSDETLALAKKQGVVLVGTEPAGTWITRFGKTDEDARIVDRLRRAYRIGTQLVFGSDIVRAPPGYSRGDVSLSVIDSWVEAGIPAADILRAMTTSAAALLGMEHQRGAIKPGYAADIIATRASPLADINNLKQVVFVMKGGVVFRSDPAKSIPR